MKKVIFYFCFALAASNLFAQATKTIALNPPDTSGGLPVMKALKLRASATKYDTAKRLKFRISHGRWAANGVNRPASSKRTAPSAINAQDIDVYVVMKTGAYLYDAPKHILTLVAEGYCASCACRSRWMALLPCFACWYPIFRGLAEGLILPAWCGLLKMPEFVSQNISLFCASENMSTRVRATMDIMKLREVLRLKDSQYPVLIILFRIKKNRTYIAK